jgi:hypothetical protein
MLDEIHRHVTALTDALERDGGLPKSPGE